MDRNGNELVSPEELGKLTSRGVILGSIAKLAHEQIMRDVKNEDVAEFANLLARLRQELDPHEYFVIEQWYRAVSSGPDDYFENGQQYQFVDMLSAHRHLYDWISVYGIPDPEWMFDEDMFVFTDYQHHLYFVTADVALGYLRAPGDSL